VAVVGDIVFEVGFFASVVAAVVIFFVVVVVGETGFGVCGRGTERGDSTPLASTGDLIFSASRGFVVAIFSGAAFFAAAT
jgi:hypothetical protein